MNAFSDSDSVTRSFSGFSDIPYSNSCAALQVDLAEEVRQAREELEAASALGPEAAKEYVNISEVGVQVSLAEKVLAEREVSLSQLEDVIYMARRVEISLGAGGL